MENISLDLFYLNMIACNGSLPVAAKSRFISNLE